MRHSIFARSSAFFIAAAALVGLSSFAAAQDCNTDADCGEGFHCESYGETCSFAPGQEEPECDAPEGGYCVRTPVECDTDADCGFAWLGCQASWGADAPPSPGEVEPNEGEAFCPPEECGDPLPEPEPGPSYCAPKEITCEADSDCPADFECAVYATSGGGSDCAVPACPEGEACDPGFSCDEQEPAPVEEHRACAPREITCNADNDCPSDWTCITESYGYCTGSGGGAVPEPGDDFAPDQDRDPGEGECFEETISRCLPAGYDYYSYAYDTATGGNGEATGNPREDSNVFGDDSDDSEASTGCSATGMTPTTGLLPMLLLGLGLVALRRR